ncbi:hypothetical protein JTE90_011506, partial [Oedothorax gibbosus]
FFATFPHGTCLLSVSRKYLALGGVYHPIKVALPSNPTPRRSHPIEPSSYGPRTHFGQQPRSRGLAAESVSGTLTPKRHISPRPCERGFGAGLLPVHSPLLRESLLVSFPPLIYMLKFSGLSRLI